MELVLTSTGVVPGATGEAELELRNDQGSSTDFQAKARGEGLTENGAFSLCVGDVFLDDDVAEGNRVDLEVALGEDPLVNSGTSSRLMVTIRSGAGDCTGTVVLQERVAVDGAFKVPGLRNVELTGPFLHNGAWATLKHHLQRRPS